MMTQVRDDLKLALEHVGINKQTSLLGMHLDEIEGEANNVLDLLVSLRAHAYRHDMAAGQESLAELTIALEHLFHHVQGALPTLQKELNLEP